MFERFTERARQSVVIAEQFARQVNSDRIDTTHLLVGLLREEDGVAARSLVMLNVDREAVEDIVAREHEGQQVVDRRGSLPMDPQTKSVLEFALREALSMGHNYIGTEHLLLALCRVEGTKGFQLLDGFGLDAGQIRETVRRLLQQRPDSPARHNTAAARRANEATASGRAPKGRKVISKFGTNMTEQAREGKLDPVVGRDSEMQRVLQILGRRTKNNPVLVGHPGVGKTAVAELLAQQIAGGDVPEHLREAELWSLDLAGMLAGTRYRGEFEERIKALLKEVTESEGKIILFLDEMHQLMGAGGAEGSMDAANILKPALARGELRLIGATTYEEFRKYVEKDAALERRMQQVEVQPPSVEDTIAILRGIRPRYESHHAVRVTDEALEAAAKLGDRYVADRHLPDKAIDLLDEAASRLRIRMLATDPTTEPELMREFVQAQRALDKAISSEAFEDAGRLRDRIRELSGTLGMTEDAPVVGEDEIAEIVSMWTGIPAHRMTEAETAKLVNLEGILGERVIGQKDAIHAISKAIRRSRSGIRDEGRPTGAFLFLGPTGVGKTELAKVLADTVFGDEDAMVRLDMSEYMEKHSVSRLIGAPPGYVGYDEGGQLTEAIRRKPWTVVLMDEVEKAHPDVFNILLQMLEDGRVTDSTGRHVDCSNVLLIMTSNLGAMHLVKNTGGFGFNNGEQSVKVADMRSKVRDAVKQHFRPELLNRLDEIVVFDRLSREEVAQISVLLLARLKRQMAEMGLHLTITDAMHEHLLDNGYDEAFGARPMRRAIQQLIEDPIAELMIAKRPPEDSTIVVDLVDGQPAAQVEEVGALTDA